MTTRVTHSVRVRDKNNPRRYIDFTVLDAIGFLRPDGTNVLFYLTKKGAAGAASVSPAIVDKTDGGNAKGDPNHCSRLSHMERFVASGDPSQKVDLEILDAIALQPPPTDPGSGEDAAENQEDLGGFIDSGDVNAAEHLVFMPSKSASSAVVDKNNLGLQVAYDHQKTTRVGHTNVVTDSGNSDDKTLDPADTTPPTRHPFLVSIKMDAISVKPPNGNNVCLFVPESGISDVDSTQYVTDPFTGEAHSPPDNKDPNIYASWPTGSGGANLGKSPTSDQTGKSGPIQQGLLWWVKKISPGFQPWYWYAAVNDYLAFSFFGSPPESASPKWGYRGFVLFDNYPVIWILSVNNHLHPMGSYGSPSLELCAQFGDWDTTGDIPNFQLTPSGGGGTFAPFGLLPMFDPPIPKVLIPQEVPNIWQMTGISQPNLATPSKPWDRMTNPYLAPSDALAEQCAQTFSANWQSVQGACNSIMSSWQPNGSLTGLGNPPAGWRWAFTYQWPHGGIGFPFSTFGAFQNGLAEMVGETGGPVGLPLEIFVPANVWPLLVGQLDPKEWDTKPSTEWPFPMPPVPWSQKTGHGPYGFTQP